MNCLKHESCTHYDRKYCNSAGDTLAPVKCSVYGNVAHQLHMPWIPGKIRAGVSAEGEYVLQRINADGVQSFPVVSLSGDSLSSDENIPEAEIRAYIYLGPCRSHPVSKQEPSMIVWEVSQGRKDGVVYDRTKVHEDEGGPEAIYSHVSLDGRRLPNREQ